MQLRYRTGLADNGLLTLPWHELGHHHLVHGRARVSHAGGDAFAGLVPEPHGVGRRCLCTGRDCAGRAGVLQFVEWPQTADFCFRAIVRFLVSNQTVGGIK